MLLYFAPLLTLGTLALLGKIFKKSWCQVSLSALLCALLDWILLALLPILKLSYGPLNPSLFLIHLARLLALALVTGILFLWKRNARVSRLLPLVGIFLQISIFLVEGYGFYIEPFQLGTTTLQEPAPQFLDERPLRILQLSDLHVEHITRREVDLLAQVNTLAPDIIVLTGDYVNIDYRTDPQTQQETHDLLAQLSAPYGIYAITGTTSVDIPEAVQNIFTGLPIRLLDNESTRVPLPRGNLYILGVTTSHSVTRDREVLSTLMKNIPPDVYTLLLYHSPDVIETATATGVDLYLAGHTHGGQVRLPIYGAIVTASAYGKEFEMGRYTRETTTLYVSRGIGMEGLSLPRVRFLAPPELVLIELGE